MSYMDNLQQLRALETHADANTTTGSNNMFDMTTLAQQLNKISATATPGVVTVPSGDKGDYATLRFGLQHFVAEAAKFKIKESSLIKINELSSSIKKIKNYLFAAEKQIGAENVDQLKTPFFREVLQGTSLEYFADDPNMTWRELITYICELFEINEEDEVELFNLMMNVNPTETITIKHCLIKILGIWKKASIEQAVGILPPVAVIVKRIISWFPPTSKAIIPVQLFEVNHTTMWSDIVSDLKTLTCVTPVELRGTRIREQPVKAKIISSNTSHKENNFHNRSNKTEIKSGKFERNYENKKYKSNDYNNQEAKSSNNNKKLGRLIRKESSNEIEFRIDTGADEHCFGKDIIPYIENRKPASGSYQVLLNSKNIKAEIGELLVSTCNDNNNKLIRLKGIINAANNMSVLSTTSCELNNGNGHFQLPGSSAKFKCFSREGFAYTTFRVVGSGKTYSNICSLLGFTASSTPKDFIFACHLKFGCAGVDTLCDTLAILGYAVKRTFVQEIINDCNRCITKTFYKGPVLTQNDTVPARKPISDRIMNAADNNLKALIQPKRVNTSTLAFPEAKRPKLMEGTEEANQLNSFLFGAVDSIYDEETLVFDHAVLKSSYLLCAKLEKRGFYFVDLCKNKNDLELITKVINTFKSSIKHVRCDQAKEFLSIQKCCNSFGINFESSTIGRNEFKGRHEATVKVVKTMFAQVIDRLTESESEYAWHPKLSTISTAFLLNTRASPTRKSIPWLTTFEMRPRYDLHLF